MDEEAITPADTEGGGPVTRQASRGAVLAAGVGLRGTG